jgi:hypothetical protein
MSFPILLEIGDVPILLRTTDADFAQMLTDRYAGFVAGGADWEYAFDIEVAPPAGIDPDQDARVSRDGEKWVLERGDFRAEWTPRLRCGRVVQAANPFAIDSVLRIVHTLVLAETGGFLVHAASAVRNGKAFLFSGLSGAGKTTISRLAPPDAALLTDEVSYVRPSNGGYRAFGTPFAGELAKIGENVSAPLDTFYLLAQGRENRIEEVPRAEAVKGVLANILFFAHDERLVRRVFQSAFDFAASVPVRRLTFVPDERVWELIG